MSDPWTINKSDDECHHFQVGTPSYPIRALKIKEVKALVGDLPTLVAKAFDGPTEPEEGQDAPPMLDIEPMYELSREVVGRFAGCDIPQGEWEEHMTNKRIRMVLQSAIELNDMKWLQDLVAGRIMEIISVLPQWIGRYMDLELLKKNLGEASPPTPGAEPEAGTESGISTTSSE